MGILFQKKYLDIVRIKINQKGFLIANDTIDHTHCGLILRYRNEDENGTSKIVCAGLSEKGTLHAAHFLANPGNSIVKTIRKKYFHWYQNILYTKIPNFVALVDGQNTDGLELIALWIIEKENPKRIFPKQIITYKTEKDEYESSSSEYDPSE